MCKQPAFELTGRRYCALLLAIVLAGVLMRAFHFHLTVGMDDQRWIIAARELGAHHSETVFPIHYARILWRCLLAGWGAAFGLSLATSAVLMFALSCWSTVMVAEGARAAFGPIAALFAAAGYAAHPLLVVYDAATLPDGFAIAILATALFLFLRYARQGGAACLLSSAFLIGLSFSAKEYYILAALPCGAYLVLKEERQAGKWRRACLFSAAVLAGFSVDLLLHWWESGNPFWHLATLTGYGGVTFVPVAEPLPRPGWERFARFTIERLAYFKWLFLDMGFVSGFLALWGMLFLAVKPRADDARWILLGVVLVFGAFLLATPTRVRPLCFVEMLPYYLTVLLPPLAIAGGGALAAAFAPAGAALRWSLLLAVALGLPSNVLVPNDLIHPLFRREYANGFVAIRHVLEDAPRQGISEVILPEGDLRVRIPDRHYQYGVRLTFVDYRDSAAAETVAYLKSDPGRALYLPRRMISWAMLDLRRGEYGPSGDLYEGYHELAALLAAQGCRAETVRVPDTVVKSWLARLGLIKRQQDLLGWLYRFE